MRIPLLPVLLLVGTASCVAPPQQQGAYCPWARQTLASMFARGVAPAPVAAAPVRPAPPVASAPAPPPAAYRPAVLPWPLSQTPGPGRLTLGNYTFRLADVEAVVTPYADCAFHPGLVARDFKLPLNGTWAIDTPPGSDVCWRRVAGPAQPGAASVTAPASPGWNRALTGAGRSIDAQL